MPSATVTIRVSRREADRPRLLQVTACDPDGVRIGGLTLTTTVDGNGTFVNDEAAPVRERRVQTPPDGIILFQWYEWPRNGPARDFTSTVTVSWDDARGFVYVEDLFD